MKVFLDTNVWLSATVFAGLCEAILTESAQRKGLLTSPLVRQEAHLVLARKFAHLPQAQSLFDAVWSEAECIADVDQPADDNDERLVQAAHNAGAHAFVMGDRRVLTWGARGSLLILSPREAWMRLFAQDGQS